MAPVFGAGIRRFESCRPKSFFTDIITLGIGMQVSVLKIFSGNSNLELATEVALRADVELGLCTATRLSDGEI